ncbi:MAG: hypothetical protein WCO00_06415 [Rhodospirillaceae bacterium]
MISSRSLLPALLHAERQGRVTFLARGPDEARYWSVLGLTQGGLRGWVAGTTHYVVEEPLESWIEPPLTDDWRRAWGSGGGSLPTPMVFVEAGGLGEWLLISAAETADILGRRSLHWALAISRPEGRWLAVPPLGYVSHDGTPALDPRFGEREIITSLGEGMHVLAALSVRLAAATLRLSLLCDKVELPVLKIGPGQSIVNEWYSVTRR